MSQPKVWMLLVAIALLALTLGCLVNRYHSEQQSIVALRRLGADIDLEPGLLGRSWPRVVGVEVHNPEFSDDGFAVLDELPDLHNLFLFGTRSTDDGLKHLSRLRGLRAICLEKTDVSDAGLNHLAMMSSLSELWVYGGGVTEAGLNRLKRALPKLKVEHRPFPSL
jgi:hypothetical protein